MNILVLGGLGYIGSRIVTKLLSDNNAVTVCDRQDYQVDEKFTDFLLAKNVRITLKDIRDEIPLRYHIRKSDVVVNLAALVGEPICKQKPDECSSVNCDAAIMVGKICEQLDKKLVFLSTCSNYGTTQQMATEDSPLHPVSLYATSKVMAEKYLIENTSKTIILRCATAYGLSDSRTRFDILLNEFVKDAIKKGRIELFMPNAYRPICHVDDLAKAVILAIKTMDVTDVFNIGSAEQNYTKRQIAEQVIREIPARLEETNGSDIRDYRVDFTKFKKATGFKTEFTIKDGIKEIHDALVSNRLPFLGSNVSAN